MGIDIEQMVLNRAKIISLGIKGDIAKIKNFKVFDVYDNRIIFCFNPKFTLPGYRFVKNTKESAYDFSFTFGIHFLSEVKGGFYS